MLRLFVSICLPLMVTCGSNAENSTNKMKRYMSDHYIAYYYGWQALSGFGIVGMILSSFLLHTFYIERKALATAVNAMICGETVNRLFYVTICIHWRTYNMIMDEPLFHQYLGREKVGLSYYSLLVQMPLFRPVIFKYPLYVLLGLQL